MGYAQYHCVLDETRPTRMTPPNCTEIGTVRHFYEGPQAISVIIAPSATVQVGDMIVIRLRDRYYQQTADSLQVNHADVSKAHGGEWAGVKTLLHQGDVPFGRNGVCSAERCIEIHGCHRYGRGTDAWDQARLQVVGAISRAGTSEIAEVIPKGRLPTIPLRLRHQEFQPK